MEWMHTWSREYGVQYCEVILRAFGTEGSSLQSGLKHQLFYPEAKNEAYHLSGEDLEGLKKRIDDALENGSIDAEIEKFTRHGEEYVALSKHIHDTPMEQLDNAALLGFYLQYYRAWITYTAYLGSMFWAAERVGEKVEWMLREKMAKLTEGEFERLAYHVSRPEKSVGVVELQEQFADLKKSPSEKKLRALHSEYQWLGCLDIHNPPFSRAEFEQYSGGYKVPMEIPAGDMEAFVRSEELKWIRLNQRFAYLKDLRDYYRRKSTFYIQRLFGEIGKRMGLGLREMSYVQAEEIRLFLGTFRKPDRGEIERRMQGFFLYEHKGEIKCITENIEAHAANIGFQWKPREHEIIKGKVASRGKVRGIAKVVCTKLELNKVFPGDILVAIITDANYIGAMNVAAGFVTDEGGILAHAAIVAREMKKPCIVGTGNATKLLKDGDLIELDDETGEVHRI